MFTKHLIGRALLPLGIALACAPSFASDALADSAALEFGIGNRVQMVRISAQKQWDKAWFESNGTHLSGYWDANLAQWRTNAYRNVLGQHENLTVINLTPVFRFEASNKRGFYGEGGIGVSLFSKLYDNADFRLSTHFQFGDHIGAGYVFDNQWEIGAKIQHYSNGGYKKPNTGVNFLVVKLARPF